MNASHDSGRPIDRWFAHYSDDHRNDTNQWIHVFAVPAILWSVVALLWCIPVAGTWFRPGLWAALAMFGAWMFYFRASRRLGYGTGEFSRRKFPPASAAPRRTWRGCAR